MWRARDAGILAVQRFSAIRLGSEISVSQLGAKSHASSYLIPLAAALLLSCRSRNAADPDALEIVVPTETATLDPRFSTRSLDVKVTRLLHAGLMGLDRNTLAPVPLLASSHRFVNETTLELELRQELRFHSGKPLHSSDVCATLSALADPALGSPHRPL